MVALLFLSGAALEFFAVLWARHATHGRAYSAALASLFYGVAQVFGLGASVKDWHAAIPFVLGYGAGTFIAVRLK